MFECFHINMAKEGWQASNFRNEVLQMTKWLTRQEKVTMFENYLHCYTNENNLEAKEDLGSLPAKSGIVRAKPERGGGRFDVVAVANTSLARATSLEGIKIGRLRLIFKLPSKTTLFTLAPPNWPSGPLAYVEWYDVSSVPGQHHHMYSVSKPNISQSQTPKGAIIPLNTICQTCQLIPLVSSGRQRSNSWTSKNVLDECSTFLLNNWASKYAYQTIW
ncbi:hypothetical protein SCLCIDRAFT_131144 [Scleroderma citrinum Foug A]|uniref:Uncharacterized protein n=1 Tax=Scleroderma citrinum Foug A TaxID=1036808 RepID=A0A0C2Z5B0_9AGAM|nr:hypothetical protein SCLCIDRAFT_131144 [Scleroderma citrinum Foug A]